MERESSVVMISSDTAFVDEHGNVVGHYDRYRGHGMKPDPVAGGFIVSGERVLRRSLFSRDYLGAPLANLFRREKATEFDSAFSYIIDYDFFAGLALRGDVYIIRERKNFFMLRAGSNTSAVLGGSEGRAYIDEHERLLKKYEKHLGIGGFGQWISVMIRRATVMLGGVYFRLKRSGGR